MRNLSERAIQTCKIHFIAGFSGAGPAFPLILWDTLIKTSNITINFLQNSRINPTLSAHTQIFGTFNYDSTPLASPGCKHIVHEEPNVRGSQSAHGLKAFWNAPAMQHYRCCELHVAKTFSKRVSDTINVLPHNIKIIPPADQKWSLAKIKDLVRPIKK